MHWSDITFDASPRVLRQFASLWLVILGALAIRCAYREQITAAIVCGIIGLTVGIPGLLVPRSIRFVFGGAMLVAFPIGWLVSQCLLVIIFTMLFVPIAIIFRLVGRDALCRSKLPESKSYWEPKDQIADQKRYFDQF